MRLVECRGSLLALGAWVGGQGRAPGSLWESFSKKTKGHVPSGSRKPKSDSLSRGPALHLQIIKVSPRAGPFSRCRLWDKQAQHPT